MFFVMLGSMEDVIIPALFVSKAKICTVTIQKAGFLSPAMVVLDGRLGIVFKLPCKI